ISIALNGLISFCLSNTTPILSFPLMSISLLTPDRYPSITNNSFLLNVPSTLFKNIPKEPVSFILIICSSNPSSSIFSQKLSSLIILSIFFLLLSSNIYNNCSFIFIFSLFLYFFIFFLFLQMLILSSFLLILFVLILLNLLLLLKFHLYIIN